jgi:site-specific recombinase XerD
VNRARRPPLQHPLAQRFEQAVDSLGAALHPDTVRHYRGTVRKFLTWLGAKHPEVCSLDQLQRQPHILGWLAHLQSQTPRLATASYINLLIHLRGIFHELARTEQLPELAHLLRREDVPRMPQRLPRPLTAQQDQILCRELLRRNDVAANALLLIRHTGMRIGECADLACDCLRSTGPRQWAIHVPLGKLKTERMVPVDSFVCQLVQRLRFFRSLPPVPADGRLLPRPRTKEALVRQLRDYLHEVCFFVNLPTQIVPHQLRHTYATEMLRSGVSFPGVMKLLGHNSSDMTMKYLDIALPDLQREFHSARSHPRHLVPQPKAVAVSVRSGLNGVIDSFLRTQHVLEMFRRTLPDNAVRRFLDQLSNRLTKILAELRNLNPPSK